MQYRLYLTQKNPRIHHIFRLPSCLWLSAPCPTLGQWSLLAFWHSFSTSKKSDAERRAFILFLAMHQKCAYILGLAMHQKSLPSCLKVVLNIGQLVCQNNDLLMILPLDLLLHRLSVDKKSNLGASNKEHRFSRTFLLHNMTDILSQQINANV